MKRGSTVQQQPATPHIPNSRILERRLDDFEAVVRLHELRGEMTPAECEEIEDAYMRKRRELRHILRVLSHLVEKYTNAEAGAPGR